MLTPAQKFRQQKLAAKAAKEAKACGGNPHGGPQGSEYQLLLGVLAEHKRKLSTISSMEAKAVYKAQAVQQFDGWVDGVLQSGTGEPDEIVSAMLPWNADAGNYRRALDIATYCIEHKLAMPDEFRRNIPEFLMDVFSEKAEKGNLGTIEEVKAWLGEVIELTQGLDCLDQPKARILKMHAFALIGKIASSEFVTEGLDVHQAVAALKELRRAFELNSKVGVKKDIEKLERYIRNTAPELLDEKVQPAPTAAQAEGNDNSQTPADA